MQLSQLSRDRYAGLAIKNSRRALTGCLVVLTAAAALHAGDHSLSPRQSRQVLDLDQPEGFATVCSPTDSTGLASVSLDSVVNTTDGPLTVTAVTTAEPDELTVVDWWLAPYDEDSPGAMEGRWNQPKRNWHSQLQADDVASVVVTVRASDPARPTSETALDLAFTTADGDHGVARTNSRLLTGPPTGCV